MVTYVLLTGKPPFFGDTKEAVYKAIKENTLNLEKSTNHGMLSEEAKDFVHKVLNKIPSERITADECLKHPWL